MNTSTYTVLCLSAGIGHTSTEESVSVQKNINKVSLQFFGYWLTSAVSAVSAFRTGSRRTSRTG